MKSRFNSPLLGTKCVSLGLLVFCLFSALAFGQTQFATLNGRVTDPSGAVVVDAVVVLTEADTKTVSQATTGGEGQYSFATLAPGNYNIRVQKQGFRSVEKVFPLVVAQRLTLDFALEIGSSTETVTVEATSVQVNTTSGDVAHVIETKDLQEMPLLTKNPYALIGLAAGAVDTAAGSGDTRGQGFAVNGQRAASVNYLLDGVNNNSTFVTGNAVTVPNDAVEEFKVQANNMTAEFGRNAVVTNVVTKSGTNSFHGTASEYYRGAGLTANTAENIATGTPKPNFVRNDFTFAVGGPIKKDKTFFFGSLEGVRVRSSGDDFWWIPTQNFFNLSAKAMQNYLTASGGIPTATTGSVITAAQWQSLNGNTGPLFDQTGAAIPDNTPLFAETITQVPVDAGGGPGQNTWNAVVKVDHHFTSATGLSFRWAYSRFVQPTGVNDSPFTDFQTAYFQKSQNYEATLTHAFSSSLFSEVRLGFSRNNPVTPLGKASPLVPCYVFNNQTGTPDGFPIVFGGYLPNFCLGNSLPDGGPQNTIFGNGGFTLAKGKHTYKWGATFTALRDNHTFGAYENGFGLSSATQSVIDGLVDTEFAVAIDPKGLVPGDVYDPTVQGPFTAPSFTRHYRYNSVGLYGEDSIRVTPRFTLSAGLRWEYFGVLHSPQGERSLDSNFLFGAVGPVTHNLFGQIQEGRFQRVNNFFQQNWGNFGPRIGFAYDLLGDHSMAIRGGYGMFYDANFGNALFNAIQNPPNYNVSTVFPSVPSLIDANEYTALTNALGPGAVPIGGSARMLNRDMKTAYSQQWNIGFEDDVLHKGIIAKVTYVGTKGDHLYSLNNLNMRGACIFAAQPEPLGCDLTGASGSTAERLNQSGVTSLNRRGNEGFSRYNGVSGEVRTRAIHGLSFDASYTFSHNNDNESSFFADSTYDTINGLGFGFRDPFKPSLDYGPSTNDIRNRYSLAYNWDIPFGNHLTGVAGRIFGGWSFSGVYGAQSGVAFSVFDLAGGDSLCSKSATNYCYPVQLGALPKIQQTPTGAPNTLTLYDLNGVFESVNDYCTGLGNPACYLTNPTAFEKRNQFRAPGLWHWDAALQKHFRITEKVGMDLRGELFNVFNHDNLYLNGSTNDISNTNPTTGTPYVTANRGNPPGINSQGIAAERRAIQVGAKISF